MRKEESPANGLRKCLVEPENGEMARARKTRRAALVASLTLQIAAISGLLLVPLLVTGERLDGIVVTPVPPYAGVPGARGPSTPPEQVSRQNRRPRPDPESLVFARGRVPDRPQETGSTDFDTGFPPGPGLPGPGVPGGILPQLGDSRGWIHQPKDPPPPPVEERRHPRIRIDKAELWHRVEPLYPLPVKRMGSEGTVRLRAIIARDGAIQSLEILGGHPILAQAARDAILHWRYRPTLLNSEPVEVETQITVIFTLNR